MNWILDNENVTVDGAYHVSENTTGSTYRYLSYFTQSATHDCCGYLTTGSGDPEIQFVPEGSYADTIVSKLKLNLHVTMVQQHQVSPNGLKSLVLQRLLTI